MYRISIKKIINFSRVCKPMLVVFVALCSMTVECKDYTIKTDGTSIYAIDDDSSQIVASGTDAATVIQGRINALTGGGRIFISSGTYILSTGLKIYNDSITIEGAGYFSTVLKLDENVNQDVIELSVFDKVSYLAFRNFKIDGNRDYNNYGSGIYGPANRCLFKDVHILNCTGYGIYITPGGYANRFIFLIVEQNNLSGIYIGSGMNWVKGCTFANCQDSGIKVCADNTKIHHCHFWNNNVNISVSEEKTQSRLFVYDNFFELGSNTEEGIKIGPYSLYSGIISGNYFRRNSNTNNDDISSKTQNAPYQMTGLTISGNFFSGISTYTGTSYSRHNIYLGTRSKNTTIFGNTFSSVSASVTNLGTSNYIYGNKIFITEDSSIATLNAGDTELIVSHNLSQTPTRVQLTPTKDAAGKRFWVDTKTETTFTIHINSAHTANITFDWWATAETN